MYFTTLDVAFYQQKRRTAWHFVVTQWGSLCTMMFGRPPKQGFTTLLARWHNSFDAEVPSFLLPIWSWSWKTWDSCRHDIPLISFDLCSSWDFYIRLASSTVGCCQEVSWLTAVTRFENPTMIKVIWYCSDSLECNWLEHEALCIMFSR